VTASEGLRLLGRGRARWIGEPFAFGGVAKGADEVLKFASGDGEHPGLSRLDPVSVRNTLGRQQRLPGTGAVLLIPNAVTHLTFKDVEDTANPSSAVWDIA
jgi:hypothetical protein